MFHRSTILQTSNKWQVEVTKDETVIWSAKSKGTQKMLMWAIIQLETIVRVCK
jgi:hypothetical protein